MFRITGFVLLFALVLAAQGGAKVETTSALSEAAVAEAVRSALDAKGLKVLGEAGKPLCEVWFRRELVTEKKEIPGAVFGQITEGSFVGVVHFPQPNSDFRGQQIKAGFYTMRYALILEDGNHQGVSATKDFVLLAPVSEDKDPNVNMTTEQLLKLSRAASGSAHPSPWSLIPVSDDKMLPKVVKNEHEHLILETKVAIKGGSIAIGLIVFGKTEG